MAVFTLVSGDDWTGLFVDGELIDEGHTLSNRTLLRYAKRLGPVTEVESLDADIEELDLVGNFPASLSDVKLASS